MQLFKEFGRIFLTEFYNNIPGVVINVFNTNSEDITIVATKARSYLENFNKINKNIKADIIGDNSVIIEQRIALLTKNGVIGFVLVLLVLTLFLHPNSAGWVAVAIPISFSNVYPCLFIWSYLKCYFIIWNDNCYRYFGR